MDEAAFFGDDLAARAIFEAVKGAIERIGSAQMRPSKSQIGFRRAHNFAAAWRPRQYLKGESAPVVLSIFLRRRDASPRWKEVVEPAPGRFTHHLELRTAADVDGEVERLLEEAWRAAG